MGTTSENGVILVTGGAGFIGSHLCDRLLARGREVVCLDAFTDFYDPRIKERNAAELARSPNFHLERADVCDESAVSAIFARYPVSQVVHLAARAGVRPSLADPVGYERTNVRGTLVLLEAVRRKAVRSFVFGSSSSVYGADAEAPFREDMVHAQPYSPYAASKRSAEHFCQVYSRLFHIPILCLRFFTVYGPRNRPDMAAFRFADAVLRGEPVTLYGDGSARRDFTYVSDTVAGVEAALAWNGEFDIVNLGNARPVTVREFLGVIEDKAGRKAELRVLPPQPGDVPLTCADATRSEALLGFRCRVSLETGVENLVSWVRAIHRELDH